MTASPDQVTESRTFSVGYATAMMAALFFVFGFVTWLNGPLITFVKLAFDLTDAQAFLVPSVFFISYFFLAIPSAGILRRTGMKLGMALGLFQMAIGSIVFGHFVAQHAFTGCLIGLFVIGSGLALLQTASNPYITALGPAESAARRIAIMGIFNKIAGIIAPIAFTILVMDGVDDLTRIYAAAPTPEAKRAILEAFAQRVYLPYLGIAAVLAMLALVVAKSKLPDIRPAERMSSHSSQSASRARSIEPRLALGILAIFLYVGVEVMAGDAIGTYAQEFGLPPSYAAYFTSATLAAMLIGYVVGYLVVPKFISQGRYLQWSAALGGVLVCAAYLTTGLVSVAFVAALGFANAMMWPTIFPLAIHGLGQKTEIGSAYLVMAISGGAIIPQIFVLAKGHLHFQIAFIAVMLPAYIGIYYFSSRFGNLDESND